MSSSGPHKPDSASFGDSPDPNRALLTEFLRHNNAPCAVCGYNLHQLSGDICPECGHRFALRVGAPSVRVGRLVACLAPMLMMFGLTVFFLIMLAHYGLPDRTEWFFLLLVVGAIDGLLAAVLYRKRVAFLCLLPDVQATLIVLSWVINALAFTAAALIIK